MHVFLIAPYIFSLALAGVVDIKSISRAYDFVICGGGAGGLVVANRLTETGATVLVIEAGASVYDNPNVTDPEGYGRALDTAIDYGYPILPQKYANNETYRIHAGKALGGSTTINGMSFTRVQKAQLDLWETVGNPGWNWANLFQYYKKSEHFQTPGQHEVQGGAAYNGEYHGYSGPLYVGYPRDQEINDFLAPLNKSYQAIGIPYSPDVNGGDLRGFTVYPMMIDANANVRSDAARAYYYPFEQRTNLQVLLNTTVTRIVWGRDGANGDATANAVEAVSADGRKVTIGVGKEVIVSAGALRTPSILELSGIGNRAILDSVNISVKVDLPGVGENLIDQINSHIDYSAHNGKVYTGLHNYVSYPNIKDIFGDAGADQFSQDTLRQLNDMADEISAQNNKATDRDTMHTLLQLQHDLIFNEQVPVAEVLHVPGTHLGLEYWSTLPFARGNIHITSSNPNTAAAINPNYFMFDYDLKVQIGIAKWYRRLMAQSPLTQVSDGEINPGFDTVAANAGDDVWAEWIKGPGNWRPNFHTLSTAIMLPREWGGVVSERLKVYGTSNVRVVDGSIFPYQVCGHLTSTIYAVAEKGSDMIKQDNGL